MKIKRDGIEIELTAEELKDAYAEQQNLFYREDLENKIDVPITDRLIEIFDCEVCKNKDFFREYWKSCYDAIEIYKNELKNRA